jgi:hypothetical protein
MEHPMEKQEKDALWGSISTLQEGFETLKLELAANTAATNEIKTGVKDLVDMFQAWKGALRVLGWLGSVAKWVGAIGAGFAGVYGAYTAFRFGVSPAEISPK